MSLDRGGRTEEKKEEEEKLVLCESISHRIGPFGAAAQKRERMN